MKTLPVIFFVLHDECVPVDALSSFLYPRATIIQQGMTKITKVEEDSISKPGILRSGDTGESVPLAQTLGQTRPGLVCRVFSRAAPVPW